LAFFDLPSGGPLRGPEQVADSNIDWGQVGCSIYLYDLLQRQTAP
jgi:hypothetical protein